MDNYPILHCKMLDVYKPDNTCHILMDSCQNYLNPHMTCLINGSEISDKTMTRLKPGWQDTIRLIRIINVCGVIIILA